MPIPIDPRKKPHAVKVHVSDGAGVDILWADGHPSHYDFIYLREHCPCAMCDEERAKKFEAEMKAPRHDGPTPAASLDPFPMFKPKVTARAAKAVGQYALQIDFSDGHATGIYSFDYLRTICPCAECEKMFRTFGDDQASGGDAAAASKS